MNFNSTNGNIPGERESGSVRQGLNEAAQDPELEAVLADFRVSVHAWSEAAYRSRALVLSPAPHRILWRRSLVWALSLVLTAGVAVAGVYEYHQKELARQAEIRRELERQRQAVQQHAREVDELLARVDSDVARETPSAMEPLASLMADDETQ
jgi:uncharacterized protein YlxW (UPF0749 family)